MITSIMLALLYWIMGVIFAVCGFCALGCMIALFLSVLYAFKAPRALWYIVPFIFGSFLSLGACLAVEKSYEAIAARTQNEMHDWLLAGAILPGILGCAIVPLLIGLANKAGRQRA